LKFSMENVIFQPLDADTPLLKGMNLTIEPGEKVIVTGKSGSGKSALIALFSGLYEKFEGKVKVNDLSIDMIHLEKYRAMVGDCLEAEQIFHGTIKENILVGRDFDQDQLDYILNLVGLKEFIYQLPNDFDTILQPEGRGFSRKLVQSILLARACVGEPKAMIMENALLHVDDDVKNRVADFLFNGNWTLLLVSQDESIFSKASQILLMEDGKVAFQGSYEKYRGYLTKNS